MKRLPEVDNYISSLPKWQRTICKRIRDLVHRAEPNIIEEIKFKNRPYFTLEGNVCALLATKDHVDVFIYDPFASDPSHIINQGQGNVTARSIQIFEGDLFDDGAFLKLVRAVVANNRKGGWRKLKKA